MLPYLLWILHHIDISSVAICMSILLSGWAIVRGIRHLNDSVTVGVWEHKVMWRWFKTHHANQIPVYPSLSLLERRQDRGSA